MREKIENAYFLADTLRHLLEEIGDEIWEENKIDEYGGDGTPRIMDSMECLAEYRRQLADMMDDFDEWEWED